MNNGFNVVVVMFSTAVAESDIVFKFFKTLAETTKLQTHDAFIRASLHVSGPRNSHEETYELLNDKAVYQVTSRLFVLVHRAKIKSCIYNAWSHPTAVAEASADVQMGTLHLLLDTTRQTMPEIKLGILDVIRGPMNKGMVNKLAAWIVKDKPTLITGYFGPQSRLVEELARICRATWKTPLYQEVLLPTKDGDLSHSQ